MLNYFRRRNIRPNPATEAQKRALAEKLQKKQSMGASNPQPQQEVEFWGQKKEQFLQTLQNQGFDFF